ncbi:MAG: hypothetical protein HQM09_00335 [Candidatus Riflebacteria bacterium]|nr:hypothetical protein [Candidatus Riflebacteria bacterium]
MRKPIPTRILTASLVAGALALAVDVGAASSPFDDKTTVTKPKTATANKAPATPKGISADELQAVQQAVAYTNQLAIGDYRGFLVSQPFVDGRITFTDGTKNYERFAWFSSIISEHYCYVKSDNSTETTTGSFMTKKKTKNVSMSIQGRGFVVKAIKNHYGGTLMSEPAQPVAPTDPALKPIVDKELANEQIEINILNLAFQVDDLIVQRNNLGVMDISQKNKIDKAIKDLKESKIPAAKNSLAANNDAIRAKFIELADADVANKNYEQAIALISASGVKSDRANLDLARSYQGLGQYDKAIDSYKTLTNSSSYEVAYNGMADCQHLKGDDRAALNSIYNITDHFTGTQEDLNALAKIDKWKLMSRTSEFPELPQKLSDAYVEKSILNAGKNKTQAVADYKTAVSSIAGNGSKSAASAQIVNDAISTHTKNQQWLDQSKMNADQRFMNERSTAQGNVNAWESSYTNAVAQAHSDYRYELSRKSQELDSARSELDYLMRNPPARPTSAPATDPYANKPSSSNTDPYSSKPSSSNTDPYGNSGNSGNSGSSNTDPYGNSGNSGSSNTNPYNNSGSTGGTDPYADAMTDYNSRVSAARAHIDQLDNDYRWLYANETSYVNDRTSNEASSLQSARDELRRYDLSNKQAYINADSDVQQASSAESESRNRANTLSSLAKGAGY